MGLGERRPEAIDPDLFSKKLTERYNQDFVNEWNTVLKTSSVAGICEQYRRRQETGKAYRASSPLLELHFISHNTDVARLDAKTHFAPVQTIDLRDRLTRLQTTTLFRRTRNMSRRWANFRLTFMRWHRAPERQTRLSCRKQVRQQTQHPKL